MSESIPYFVDGDFDQPVLLARSIDQKPYAKNGDASTTIFSETFIQEASKFSSAISGGAVQHATRAGFYLLDESQPQQDGSMCTFVRTWRSLTSSPRYSYGSVTFDRPTISDMVIGGSRWVSFDDGVTSTRFTTSKAIDTATVLTGGTYIGSLDVKFRVNPNHAVGDLVAFWSGNKLIFTATNFWGGQSYTDAYGTYWTMAIAKEEVPADLITASLTHATVYGRDTMTSYANGAKVCSGRSRVDTYLVGVSAGISTPADIVLTTAISTPAQWAAAIANGTAWVSLGTQSVNDLGGGWIEVESQDLQLSDAVEVV